MKRQHLIITGMALGAMFCVPAYCEENVTANEAVETVKAEPKNMSEALAPWVESGELPGYISILLKPGAEDVAVCGYADAANKVPMSLDAMFMQCSQTKGFCGVTVAMLVEEGKLNLDDPVAKYLPEFEARPSITVRMCMNHTAGFPFEVPSKEKKGWHHLSLADTVKEAAALEPLFEPGTKVKYSNTGIDVGAAVVEKIAGKPWHEFLQERVLDPLEMKDSTFWPSEEQLSRRIKLYSLRAGQPAVEKADDGKRMRPPWNGPEVYASAGAGLWTTARDQVKFYKMLMNLGVGENGVRLLKEETVKDLLATSSRPKGKEPYSLGLNVKKDGWFGHGGAWSTAAYVNWKTKELDMWVVQQQNHPRPWEKVRDEQKSRFFAAKTDANDAYTGRLK